MKTSEQTVRIHESHAPLLRTALVKQQGHFRHRMLAAEGKDLDALMKESRENTVALSRLRVAIGQHYGNHVDDHIEFDLAIVPMLAEALAEMNDETLHEAISAHILDNEEKMDKATRVMLDVRKTIDALMLALQAARQVQRMEAAIMENVAKNGLAPKNWDFGQSGKPKSEWMDEQDNVHTDRSGE